MNIALVLNYQSPRETIQCAESILNHCPSINLILIVDNASSDNSSELIGSWCSRKDVSGRAVFLPNSENSGYAGGNNFGIEWARKNLKPKNYWVVNSDAFVKDDAFSPMLNILESSDGFVGSVVVSGDSGKLECFGGGDIYPILGKARLYQKGVPLTRLPEDLRTPDYLMGCSLAFSNALVSRLGLMDEAYFMYSEEVDWQYRGKKLGVPLSVCRSSVIYHAGSGSSGGKSEFYYYYRNRAAVRFNKRYYGNTLAFLSAVSLAFFMLVSEFSNPRKVYSGVTGAFAGVLMDV